MAAALTCLYCGLPFTPRHEETCEALALERVTTLRDPRDPAEHDADDSCAVCEGLWLEDDADDERRTARGG